MSFFASLNFRCFRVLDLSVFLLSNDWTDVLCTQFSHCKPRDIGNQVKINSITIRCMCICWEACTRNQLYTNLPPYLFHICSNNTTQDFGFLYVCIYLQSLLMFPEVLLCVYCVHVIMTFMFPLYIQPRLESLRDVTGTVPNSTLLFSSLFFSKTTIPQTSIQT
jgi:hypothetical protein